MDEAVRVSRQALLVLSREQLPSDWATTQIILGRARELQSARAAPELRSQLLSEAVEAFQQALLVFTREDFPSFSRAMASSPICASDLR